MDLPTTDLVSGRQIANQSAPFIARIPEQVLRPTGNTVDVELEPGGLLSGFLDTIYVGPDSDLRASFTWHYYRFLRGPTLVVFWQILLSAMLLMLWLSRRQERAALFCSLYLLTGCIHALPMLIPHLKDFADQLTMFTYVATFWQASFAFMFIASLLNRALPFHWIYIFAAPAFATMAYTILPESSFQYVSALVVIPFSLALGFWIIAMVANGALRQGRWDCQFLLASGLGGMAMGVHDTLIISNIIDTSNSLKNSVVLVIFLPSISLIFLRHLIDSLDNVDTLVESLEHRVHAKETQLRQAFDERRALERQKALSDERQRIMQDVHDGLGGQLMSIIALSRGGSADSKKIETSAQSALEEMRMVIGSLAVDDDITGMLRTFRERAEQQLNLFGIALEWQMTHIPLIDGLTPSHALNVLRILQEATTNAAKHSGATKLVIRFSVIPGSEADLATLKIEIEDNGRGYSAPETNGHGIKNMKRRAVALGGKVTKKIYPNMGHTIVQDEIDEANKIIARLL